MSKRVGVGAWSTTSLEGVLLRGARWASAIIAVSSVVACGSPIERRGKALYPAPAQPLPRSEVAVIGGYVGEIDGRDISEETGVFEVLPGCHVVRTLSRWGATEADGEMSAETGRVPFALPMKGGHWYEIKVVTSGPSAPVGTYVIEAIETDPAGNPSQTFSPTTEQSELDACSKQAAAAPSASDDDEASE
jgi:hypothetical protein